MKLQQYLIAIMAMGMLVLSAVTGCTTSPSTPQGKTSLRTEADLALSKVKENNPRCASLLPGSAGYAVFPTVGKAAVGLGGAYGKGVLYQNGRFAGYCDLTQATLGAALGLQSYTEVVVFQNKETIDRFKSNNLAFDAQASAVAAQAGRGTNADYMYGVAVFTTDEAGLMAEASIGGQRFTFQQASGSDASAAR